MKKIIYIIFGLFSLNLYAQPGDVPILRAHFFNELTKQIRQDPDNYELIWERMEISFHPRFNIFTKSGELENVNTRKEEFEAFANFQAIRFEGVDILADINKLIDNKVVFNEFADDKTGLVDFVFLRGKAYYLMGETEKALDDYLYALNSDSNYREREDICTAIAAYYYNAEENISEENARQVLKYIDMISIELTNNAYFIPNSNPLIDIKIGLLKYLKEDIRLENYHKKLILAHYERSKSMEKSTGKYDGNDVYHSTLMRIYHLAKFYYENKKYERAEQFLELLIAYCPQNEWGHVHRASATCLSYRLLNEMYRTEEFEDFDKEMYYLVEHAGTVIQTNYSPTAYEKYLTERLQNFPDEPRLYFALAVLKLGRKTRFEYDEILRLLDKSEQLGLKDYRISLAEALAHYHKENYTLALKEINKALSYQGNPLVYWTKYNILKKMSSTYESELRKMNEYANRASMVEFKELSELIKESQL